MRMCVVAAVAAVMVGSTAAAADRQDPHEQARALSALFDAFLPEPWFSGFFVWRYYANLDDVSQEHAWGFSPHGKVAEPMLEQVFHWDWAVDPASVEPAQSRHVGRWATSLPFF